MLGRLLLAQCLSVCAFLGFVLARSRQFLYIASRIDFRRAPTLIPLDMIFSLPSLFSTLALLGGLVSMKLMPRSHAPVVNVDSGKFPGASSGAVSKFLGIPFAEPPIGDRRFKLPEPLPAYTRDHRATTYGPSCPQQAFGAPFTNGPISNVVNVNSNGVPTESEDCLTLNVIAPASATAESKLPVVAWIYGGAFAVGGTIMNDGTPIVERSIQLGQPIIYVSMNYRLNAFGFLASKEVKAEGVGNLGLQDQRLALRWIQKYITQFGGDPTKVTIWGESAGAISVGSHMVSANATTESLFRAAFMESGSPLPVGDISHGQGYYDFLVDNTDCSGSSDTLACLRGVKYSKLKAAIDKTPSPFSYQALSIPWLPRTDGVFFPDMPQKLVQQGKIADIPFVTGVCDDEGTIFSLSTLNITTTADFKVWIKTIWLPGASDRDINKILELYPEDPSQGSPYGTGTFNPLSPQLKRIASFQGDFIFQGPRRFILQHRSDKQNAWSFLSKRMKFVPIFGAYHASDIQNVYSGGDMTDYLVRFVATQDPNGNTGIDWPKYTTAAPYLLTFNDGVSNPLSITQDAYRKDAIEHLSKVTFEHPM